MDLTWNIYDSENLDDALGQSFCLYVFHHADDGNRPFYIGKAKYFGTKQASGYKGSARYNSGYVHLIVGMLRSGFKLYISPIGESNFEDSECYEQELIALWNPIRPQKRKDKIRKGVITNVPWASSLYWSNRAGHFNERQ